MNAIYKYPLMIAGRQTVDLPRFYTILSLQVQHNQPCLWVMVDTEETKTFPVQIIMHGTGHPIEYPNHLEFIDTFQIDKGKLVFHAFKER